MRTGAARHERAAAACNDNRKEVRVIVCAQPDVYTEGLYAQITANPDGRVIVLGTNAGGPTVFLTPENAREYAKALLAAAHNIDGKEAS